ncbi:MAG: DUF2807 domain-containing protein [Bacteroidaceae bacterium]|nr:DUF2807 domain-containing protein [Bacteroidaceae bacterium]
MITTRSFFQVGLAVLVLLTTACTGEKKQNNNNPDNIGKTEVDSTKIVRRHQICEQGFYQITHIGTFDVIYREGDYSLEYEGDSTLFPSMVAEFDSGTLTLSRRGENNTDVHAFSSRSNLKVYVSCPELRLLAVCNSGSFRGLGTIHTTDMQIGVMGSGSVVLDSVQCNTLMVQNNDAGGVTITSCRSQSIDLLGKGSGNVSGGYEVEGEANLTFSGSATNDLSCKAKDVTLLSTGDGTTNLNVDCDKLNIQAVGNGTLNLDGQAHEKNYLTSPLSNNALNVKLTDNVKGK